MGKIEMMPAEKTFTFNDKSTYFKMIRYFYSRRSKKIELSKFSHLITKDAFVKQFLILY